MKSTSSGGGSMKDRKGIAALEFALIAPVLLLMIFGMATFGIALNNYLTLTDAVRAGARTLSTSRGSTTPFSGTTSAITAAAPTLTASTLTAGITMTVNGTPCTSDAACATTLSASTGSATTVSASYPCNLTVMGFNFAPTCSLTSMTTERVE
jgi:Flp pilus assembly protein TadG